MTPENLHACIADAASAIIAGNRLIGRLNVESAIGSDSETIDTWLLYAWTADDPAGAQLAIERAIQMDPENPLAVAGKTWIEGVKSLAETQVREREQWSAEQLALEEAATALAAEDDVCETDEDSSAEREVDEASDVVAESKADVRAEVEAETESEAESVTEVEETPVAETAKVAETAVAAEPKAEVEADSVNEAAAEVETEPAVEVEANVASEAVAEEAEGVAEAIAEPQAESPAEAEAATDVEPEEVAPVANTVEAESTSEDNVQAADDSGKKDQPVAVKDNSREAALAAARIASSVASVASQPAELENVEQASSLADDIRDSLKASIDDLSPAEVQSDDVVADSAEATVEPAPQPVQNTEPVAAAPAEAVSSVEATEEIEESVVQDLEEMTASVSEAVQPAPAIAPVQKVVDVPPVAPAVEEPAAQTPAQPAYDASEPRSAVVMIVDDSPTIRKLVSMTLSRNGFEVIAAKDGVDALKLLTQQRPDIILTDINMPRLGGYKLCRFVKKQPKTKSIPVLMLSGKDGVFDKMKGKMAGASGHITKPFESADLVHQVRQQLLAAAGV